MFLQGLVYVFGKLFKFAMAFNVTHINSML